MSEINPKDFIIEGRPPHAIHIINVINKNYIGLSYTISDPEDNKAIIHTPKESFLIELDPVDLSLETFLIQLAKDSRFKEYFEDSYDV